MWRRYSAPYFGSKAVLAMLQQSCFTVAVSTAQAPMDFQLCNEPGTGPTRDEFVAALRKATEVAKAEGGMEVRRASCNALPDRRRCCCPPHVFFGPYACARRA